MFSVKQKTRKLLILLQLVNDTAVIFFSFVLAYILKFKLYVFGLTKYKVPTANFEAYYNVIGYIIMLWLFAFFLNGLYKQYTGPLASIEEFKSIFKGVLFGTFEVMAFTFIYKTFPESRFVLGYAALIAILALSVTRNLLNIFINWLHSLGLGNIRTAIIGHSVSAQRVAEKIITYPEFGYNYIGFINNQEQPGKLIHPLKDKYRFLGKTGAIKELIKKHNLGSLVLADNLLPLDKIYELANFCLDNNIIFRFIPSKYQLKQYTISFDLLDTIPLLKIRRIEFSWFNRFLKRTFDLVIAVPLFICFCPLMALIALFIRLTSPGEIVYKQRRITRQGREFDFYKFRSMKVNAEKGGRPVLSTRDQHRRTTSIGNFLRKSSLDELPQLWNVIIGDMSLVGPRPERPFFHEKYKKSIPGWEDRLTIRGGITGWAQLNGRAELSATPDEKLDYDLYYIANWSLLFDIKILLNTIRLVLQQKDTY